MGKTLIKDPSGNQTTRMHVTAFMYRSSYVQRSAVWAVFLLLNDVATVFIAYWVSFVCFKKQIL